MSGALDKARRRLAKLRALAADDAAAPGERRNARRREADLLFEFPALDASTPPPPQEKRGAPGSGFEARRRAQAHQARARTAPPEPTRDELLDLLREPLRDFLHAFGGNVSRRYGVDLDLPWLDDD